MVSSQDVSSTPKSSNSSPVRAVQAGDSGFDYPPGQLTCYPVGSVRELWQLSYPLMLSLFSFGIMILVDRLFLASISVAVFNGVSEAAMFFMAFEFSIVTLAAIAEVLVGRFFGARQYDQVSRPVWAMIWMSLFCTAVFIPIGYFGTGLLFEGSPYHRIAADFFSVLCYFGPLFPLNAALSSFWIGRGRVAFVTTAVAITSLLNVFLDYMMIFGHGPFPEMGVKGAAIATGIAQFALSLILFIAFMKAKYRRIYRTDRAAFDFEIFKKTISIGFPQALAMLIQCLAWACFFRVMSLSSDEHALICGIAQAIFFFFNFVIEGVSKAGSSIVANLIGSKRFSDIRLVSMAGVKLLAVFAALIFAAFFFFPNWLLHWFLPANFVLADEGMNTFYSSLFWIWVTLMGEALLFFWAGVLLAFQDSKFILWVSSVAVWLLGVIPASIATLIFHQGPNTALAIASCYYAVAGVSYYLRIQKHLKDVRLVVL